MYSVYNVFNCCGCFSVIKLSDCKLYYQWPFSEKWLIIKSNLICIYHIVMCIQQLSLDKFRIDIGAQNKCSFLFPYCLYISRGELDLTVHSFKNNTQYCECAWAWYVDYKIKELYIAHRCWRVYVLDWQYETHNSYIKIA